MNADTYQLQLSSGISCEGLTFQNVIISTYHREAEYSVIKFALEQ